MRIDIGPFRYTVQLVHGMIRHAGTDCYGLCDNLTQRILVSDVPGETQRLSVFFHELMHAWWYHFGIDPADEEAVADLVGVAMTQFMQQAADALRGRGQTLRATPMTGAPTPPLTGPDDANESDMASNGQAIVAEPLRRMVPDQTRHAGAWVIRFYAPVAG